MITMAARRVPAIAAALFAVASVATAARLKVRTGLWEITTVGETTGLPPIPSGAAVMDGTGTPQTVRACITEKTLRHGLDFSAPERPNCTRSVKASSSRHVDVRMECTGDAKSTGTFHIEAVDRQTIAGSFNLVVSIDGNVTTVTRSMKGKWLNADCGDVKPME